MGIFPPCKHSWCPVWAWLCALTGVSRKRSQCLYSCLPLPSPRGVGGGHQLLHLPPHPGSAPLPPSYLPTPTHRRGDLSLSSIPPLLSACRWPHPHAGTACLEWRAAAGLAAHLGQQVLSTEHLLGRLRGRLPWAGMHHLPSQPGARCPQTPGLVLPPAPQSHLPSSSFSGSSRTPGAWVPSGPVGP